MAATAFSITCASVPGRVRMRMSAKHMAPESIAHITIQLWPRASIMQRLVLLPIFSRDSANQQLRQCPQLLLPHLFPPWGILTLLINPYLLMDKKLFLIIKRMKMMLNNFLPFNVFGIAPILKKIPLDGSVYGAVMCLSLSMLHVPSIM